MQQVLLTGLRVWVMETLQRRILSFAVDNNRCCLFPYFLI